MLGSFENPHDAQSRLAVRQRLLVFRDALGKMANHNLKWFALVDVRGPNVAGPIAHENFMARFTNVLQKSEFRDRQTLIFSSGERVVVDQPLAASPDQKAADFHRTEPIDVKRC